MLLFLIKKKVLNDPKDSSRTNVDGENFDKYWSKYKCNLLLINVGLKTTTSHIN